MTVGDGNPKVLATPQGVRFVIHVSPRAHRVRVGGRHGDALRVAVTAPPADDAANQACVVALAEALGLRRAEVRIASGRRGRRKGVEACGDPERLARRIAELASGEG